MEHRKSNLRDRVPSEAKLKQMGSDPHQLEFDFTRRRANMFEEDRDIYRDIRYILGTYGVNFDGGI